MCIASFVYAKLVQAHGALQQTVPIMDKFQGIVGKTLDDPLPALSELDWGTLQEVGIAAAQTVVNHKELIPDELFRGFQELFKGKITRVFKELFDLSTSAEPSNAKECLTASQKLVYEISLAWPYEQWALDLHDDHGRAMESASSSAHQSELGLKVTCKINASIL